MDLNQKASEITSPATAKSCADCNTTRTPLWRSGPAGPRSLCNACGIRQRKRRRALLGLGKGASEKKIQKQSQSKSSSEMAVSVNLELVELQRSLGSKKEMVKMKKKMREEEVAAMLLMALSCGSVFA